MSISTTLQTGVQGVQQGIQGMEKAAGQIAQAATGEAGSVGELAAPLVELKLYEQSVEASAKVVKTADEVLGTLLDTMA